MDELAQYDEDLMRIIDRYVDGTSAVRDVLEAAERWRHADRTSIRDEGGRDDHR